MEAYN